MSDSTLTILSGFDLPPNPGGQMMTPYDDTLTGGRGNDTLDGGAGTDTVAFSVTRAQFQISVSAGAVLATGPNGTDTLLGVERLKFSDNTCVAFDTGGDAGQAYRMYQAAFNRAPDVAGLGYWITAMDNGQPLLWVASNFIASPEFTATYGSLNSMNFVAQMYLNVLHRPGEPAGAQWWQGEIDQGLMTRAQVLQGFSESAENQGALIGVIQNGMTYTV